VRAQGPAHHLNYHFLIGDAATHCLNTRSPPFQMFDHDNPTYRSKYIVWYGALKSRLFPVAPGRLQIDSIQPCKATDTNANILMTWLAGSAGVARLLRYRTTLSAISQRSAASERAHVTRVTQDKEGQPSFRYLIFSLGDVLRDKNGELLNLAPNPNPATRAAPHHDSCLDYHSFLLLGATQPHCRRRSGWLCITWVALVGSAA
jgi:hypothetical protein